MQDFARQGRVTMLRKKGVKEVSFGQPSNLFPFYHKLSFEN